MSTYEWEIHNTSVRMMLFGIWFKYLHPTHPNDWGGNGAVGVGDKGIQTKVDEYITYIFVGSILFGILMFISWLIGVNKLFYRIMQVITFHWVLKLILHR